MQVRRKLALALTFLSVTLVALSGCSDATGPASDMDDPASWVDFPAVYGVDSDRVLEAPLASEVETRSSAILSDLAAAFEEAYQVTTWRVSGAPIWSAQESNGYGGESLITMFNSEQYAGETIIAHEQWAEALELAGEVLETYGLTNPHGQATIAADSWVANGMFTRGTEWVNVSVQDLRLNDAALQAAQQQGTLISGVMFVHGVTTVADEDRAEFERRARPFIGVPQPAPDRGL